VKKQIHLLGFALSTQISTASFGLGFGLVQKISPDSRSSPRMDANLNTLLTQLGAFASSRFEFGYPLSDRGGGGYPPKEGWPWLTRRLRKRSGCRNN